MKLNGSMLALILLAAPAIAAIGPGELDAARALFDANKLPQARLEFERLAKADPADPEVHYYLGQIALQRDDTDTAVRELERSVALSPVIARTHNALGDAFGRAAQKAGVFSQFGLARRSLAEYGRAVALEPDNVDFHESLFSYYVQAPKLVGGGVENAEDEAAAIKKLDPSRGRRAYATLYVAEQKYDLALAELDATLKAEPDDYASLYQVGKIAAMSGQHFERGVAALHRCLELAAPPDAPSHAAAEWRLGNILEKKNDPGGARAAYEAALKMDPSFTAATEALKKLK
jgi:tetratricopeptide (TPR) repeat protein